MNQAENTNQTGAAVQNRGFLTFALGQEQYAIPIEHVQELRGYENVTQLANAPAHIKGVINLRGTIVPIIDLRVKLGLPNPRYDHLTVVVVVNIGVHTVGMVVDGVSDVVVLAPEQIKPAPVLPGLPDPDSLTGIADTSAGLLILVDIERLAMDRQLMDMQVGAAVPA